MLKRAEAADPKPSVHYNLCCVKSLMNKKQAALHSLRKAVELGFSEVCDPPPPRASDETVDGWRRQCPSWVPATACACRCLVSTRTSGLRVRFLPETPHPQFGQVRT